jgi:UDP-N-acetylglucosamine:LPS N-acetylglucosamine transferase
MRITMVISSLDCGGAERVMSTMANYWAERGEEVTILSFDHGDPPFYPLHPRVRHRPLGWAAESSDIWQGLFWNLRRIRVLRHAVRGSRPDVVISFVDKVNTLTLLATRGLGFPVIVEEIVERPFANWSTLNWKGKAAAFTKQILWWLGQHGSGEWIYFRARKA